jgi:ABC-type branched-subunit amino acid transport system ATPase component
MSTPSFAERRRELGIPGVPGWLVALVAAVLSVRDLVKRFDDVEAVSGVSFGVAPEEAFAFLGPNGAGKTTTISILGALNSPDRRRGIDWFMQHLSEGARVDRMHRVALV